MSKKTRKKSPKTPAGKVARPRSRASAEKPAAKTGKAAPKKSSKSAVKPPAKPSAKTSTKPSAKESHKAPSKPLKYDRPAPALAEGAKAPAFRLPRDGGDTVALADFSGKKLVLFFYPRADTPGCTKEAIEFTRLAGSFAESGTAVVGISADPVKAQVSFRDKHQLAIPLVSDEKHEMLEAYGVWGEKAMYGKIFQGILRTTMLIGKDGRIIRIWRNVRVDGHADEVLAAARGV